MHTNPEPPSSEVIILSQLTYRENESVSEQELIQALIVRRENLTLSIVETIDGKRTEIMLNFLAGANLRNALNEVFEDDNADNS